MYGLLELQPGLNHVISANVILITGKNGVLRVGYPDRYLDVRNASFISPRFDDIIAIIYFCNIINVERQIKHSLDFHQFFQNHSFFQYYHLKEKP